MCMGLRKDNKEDSPVVSNQYMQLLKRVLE